MPVPAVPTHPPRRVLVFGGTFDPPHLAHATLPAQAAVQLQCDRILYVPAAINPLKTDHPAASNEDRLAMLLLATADVPNARISTIELDRPGPSYTIDTLRALQEEYRRDQPPAELRLLIGSDQALDFHRWKDWREIMKIATPAVMLRHPFKDEPSFHAALLKTYSPSEADAWMSRTLRLPIIDISATQLRQRLCDQHDETLQDWLDPGVLEYIRKNNLYAE